jgi:RNA polymerase sigma factor (sigma-70 family)
MSLELLDPQQPTTLDAIDWLALDEALTTLADRDPRRHQVVMLRFFAGLGEVEVAELLGVEERTVRRDWASAKVWLYSQLSGADAAGP